MSRKEKASNRFDKIHADNHPLFQSENSAIEILNSRILNNGEGNYSIVSEKGNELSFTLKDGSYEIVGWCSDGDKIYILSNTDSMGYSWDEISEITFDKKTGTGTYKALYSTPYLIFSRTYLISQQSIRIIKENENIKRLYWSDYFQEPGCINVNDSRLQTNHYSEIALAGSSGKKYMVTNGTVTYNGITYGPHDLVNGNIITSVGVAAISSTGNVYVVEYIPENLIRWSPDRTMPTIVFEKFDDTGRIRCGTYIAFVRLKSTVGYASPWLPGYQPIFLGYPTINWGRVDYQKYEGKQDYISSEKAIYYKVQNIDTRYEKIELAIVRMVGRDTFDDPVVVFSGDVTGEEMSIKFDGIDTEYNITVDDLTEILTVFKKVKTFDSIQSRMIVGCSEVLGDISKTFDPSNATISPFTYEVMADAQAFNTGSKDNPQISVIRAEASITAGADVLMPKQWYRVLSGVVTYNGNTYISMDVFQQNGTVKVLGGGGTVRAVIKRMKFAGKTTTAGPTVLEVNRHYEVISGGPITHDGRTYNLGDMFYAWNTAFTGAGTVRLWTGDLIDIKDDYYSAKGIAVQSSLMGYKRNEKYRIGVMPIDIKGRPMFVRWIRDIDTPRQYDTNYQLMNKYGTAYNNYDYVCQHLGLSISGLDLTDIASQISGIVIVRAERVKRAVCSGLLLMSGFKDNTIGGGGPFNVGFDYKTLEIEGDIHMHRSKIKTEMEFITGFISPDMLFDEQEEKREFKDFTVEIQDFLTDDYYLENSEKIYPCSYAGLYGWCIKRYQSVTPGSPAKGTKRIIKNGALRPIEEYKMTHDIFKISSKIHTLRSTNINQSKGGTERQSILNKITVLVSDDYSTSLFDKSTKYIPHRPIVDIIKTDKISYGPLQDTLYYSTGYYLPINAKTYSDNGNSWIFNNMQIWGGDIFLGVFDYTRSLAGALSLGDAFPVESNVNFLMRRGRHWAKDNVGNTTNSVSYTQPENFILDDQYNVNTTKIMYPALPNNFDENTLFERRSNYSEVKFDGEEIDNYRRFLANNFRDLEHTLRAIQNIERKTGKLYVWQERGISYMPVNERALVGDPLAGQIQIGTSGVIDHHMEFSDKYYMYNRFSLITLDDKFAWFDRERMSINIMSIAGQSAEISTITGIKSIIREYVYSTDLSKEENAGINIGVISGYNEDKKEFLFTIVNENKGITIAVSELTKVITGLYSYTPHNYLKHGNWLLSSVNTRYSTIANSTEYSVDDILKDINGIYRCILAYTSGNPATIPSADAIHWELLYKLSDVYKYGTGDICKFFEIVYDEKIRFSVNPNPLIHKTFSAIEIYSTEIPYDTIRYENDNQQKTDNFSRFVYRKGAYKAAISRELNSRTNRDEKKFKGGYLIVELTKQHKTTNIKTSDNEQLTLFHVITSYRRNHG